jgi:hypothetical protein
MSRIPRGCLKALYPESCHTAPFDVAQNGTTESIDPRLRFEHSTGGLQVRNYLQEVLPTTIFSIYSGTASGTYRSPLFFCGAFSVGVLIFRVASEKWITPRLEMHASLGELVHILSRLSRTRHAGLFRSAI